jgi:putative intracellular protease/amidase
MIVSSAPFFALRNDPEHPTGYFAEEVIRPYDKFIAAGAEVRVATPDGQPPRPDSYGLMPFFHFADEDEDFLAGISRSFQPDVDDIRITLHHLSELDLIAARRVLQALVQGGLDGDAARSLVAAAAKTAWAADHSFVDVLAADQRVTSVVTPGRLRELADEAMGEGTRLAAEVAQRLAAIEILQNPLDLSKMADKDMLAFDAVFFPGGHGPMADLADNVDVGRLLGLMIPAEDKTVATICHGAAALLSAGNRSDGYWLFDGYKLTAFTDEEEEQTLYGKLGVPWYLETELKNRGAVMDDADAAWTSHVVIDRNLISGQNPSSADATAEAVLKKLGVLQVS